MRNRRLSWLVVPVFLWSAGLGAAFALSLDEAKSKGLVGEKANGYLGVVKPGSQEAQSLTIEVNLKRREAYQDIAARNKTQLETVENERLARESIQSALITSDRHAKH